MITISITLKDNHISVLDVDGHADFFPIGDEVSIKGMFAKKQDDEEKSNIGNIPCASISILCKSFVDSILLYASQRKQDPKEHVEFDAKEKGRLSVELQTPSNDPMHVHRYAIEQLLIVGIQAVAKEYPNDVKLSIKNLKSK